MRRRRFGVKFAGVHAGRREILSGGFRLILRVETEKRAIQTVGNRIMWRMGQPFRIGPKFGGTSGIAWSLAGENLFFTTSLQIVCLAVLANYDSYVALLAINKVVQVAHVCSTDLAA
jgi:hypothetical protein